MPQCDDNADAADVADVDSLDDQPVADLRDHRVLPPFVSLAHSVPFSWKFKPRRPGMRMARMCRVLHRVRVNAQA
jgi:hypothetical protein